MRRWNVAGWLFYLACVLFVLLVAWIARTLCDDKGGWWSTCRPMPWDHRGVLTGQTRPPVLWSDRSL